MSSKTAEDFIRQFMSTVWDKAQVESAEAFVTTDYIDHAYNGGVDSLKAQIAQLQEAFPGSLHTIEDILVDGDRVMLRARLQGRHTGTFRGTTPTGASIDVRVARWFRLESGKIAEHWALLDTISLFRQIGKEPFAPAA
ncbi:ester cyclase [Microvirga flavescens]|uniref:ester cyclase n=1 Tax=Microvirga flavescens TaxID=2249811 RepID=UPI0013006568|nr:ester cyclase [Microvirga flavescens]